MPGISIGTLVLVFVVALFVANSQFVEVSLEKLTAGDIGTLLMTLIFTALIIERAVEVYINNAYGPAEDKKRSKIILAERTVELAEEALTTEQKRLIQSGGQPDDVEITKLREGIRKARKELLQEKHNAAPQLVELRREKGAWAGTVSTLLSLGAAAVGVRILGQFLPLNDSGDLVGPLANTCAAELARQHGENVTDLPETTRAACKAVEFQLATFRTVDTILTTFVLAGGADGIHEIIKRFRSYRSSLS